MTLEKEGGICYTYSVVDTALFLCEKGAESWERT